MTTPSPRTPREPLPDNQLGLHLGWLATSPLPALAASLHARGTHPPQTLPAVVDHTTTLASLVAAHGPTEAAARYLNVNPALRRDRVAAAVAACAIGHIDYRQRDGWPAGDRQLRLLSPIEIGTLRLTALPWPQRAASVAMAEQGATTTQIAHIDPTTDVHDTDRGIDVDLGPARGVAARTITVADWATDAVRTATQQAITDGHELCLAATRRAGRRGPRNITATLDRALAVAGADATASSIRLTAAHRALLEHGPPAAATSLGATSVTATLRLLDRLT